MSGPPVRTACRSSAVWSTAWRGHVWCRRLGSCSMS
jgi:hypothetical protein